MTPELHLLVHVKTTTYYVAALIEMLAGVLVVLAVDKAVGSIMRWLCRRPPRKELGVSVNLRHGVVEEIDDAGMETIRLQMGVLVGPGTGVCPSRRHPAHRSHALMGRVR
jgi:hypothetical protein